MSKKVSDIEQIARSLDVYGDLAASEAITRGLIAERNGNREESLFWMLVFQAVCEREGTLTDI